VHTLVQPVVQRDGDDRTGTAAPTAIGVLVWKPPGRILRTAGDGRETHP